MNPKVSVIVPTYNAEIYIKECILSIINQTYKNIELIIVDDGSKDKTSNIINEIIRNDDRIKLITQKNSGPSNARNRGIEESTGEYLVFVDADDKIDNIYIDMLVKNIHYNNYSLSACGYIDVSKYGIIKLNHFWLDKDELNKDEFINCIFSGVGGVLWAKIFRRDVIIINDIRMDSNIFMSEDMIFLLEYCKFGKRFGVINENLYTYNRLNENSISSNINIDYLDNYSIVINRINELLNSLKVNELQINKIRSNRIKALINIMIVSETYNFLSIKSKKVFIDNLKKLFENKLVKEYKKSFINYNNMDKILNHLIKHEKYLSLLYLNIIVIYLRKLKDKILRR